MEVAHGVRARGHPHAKPARSTSHDHKQVNSIELGDFALQLDFRAALSLFCEDDENKHRSPGGRRWELIGGGGGGPHGQRAPCRAAGGGL